MTVIHPLMLFLCAAGCVAGALGGQWMHLLPDTKGVVGDILFDYGLERGKWWGMVAIPPLERAAQGGDK